MMIDLFKVSLEKIKRNGKEMAKIGMHAFFLAEIACMHAICMQKVITILSKSNTK